MIDPLTDPKHDSMTIPARTDAPARPSIGICSTAVAETRSDVAIVATGSR